MEFLYFGSSRVFIQEFNSVFSLIYIITTLLRCKVRCFQNWCLERKPSQFYGTIMEQPKVNYRDYILMLINVVIVQSTLLRIFDISVVPKLI